ncbi:MAG: ABC transporter ATP-binding protein [Roseibium sp.]
MLKIEHLATPLIGPIDLELEAGCCTAVSGPSGAGKSLLLRAISDLDESTGSVSLNGKSREAYSAPDWRKHVAYIPAESGWWADRVKDHFKDTPELKDLLNTVGLPDAMDWQVSRLSTGERQRLALVRALQLNPDVLLLDEPTSALDPPSVERVEGVLKHQLADGKMLLLVSHDPEQPKRLGARHMHITAGKLTDAAVMESAQ